MRFKRLCLITVCLWSMMAMGQEADFEIRNFRERTTDLSAISSNYKDLNGHPAALIRFTVRDSKFEFDANLGIIAQKKKTGEVYLYVPQDTRRITVRHPRLGVLKDYVIPVKVISKVTYDADIVITGIGQSKPSPFTNSPQTPPTYPYEPQSQTSPPTYPYEPQPQPKSPKYYSSPEFQFYAGVGFNVISAMGPSIHLGASYSKFHLGVGYVLGLDKVEDIRFSYGGNQYSYGGSSVLSEAYDYSCSKFWIRAGYSFGEEEFRISPQIGATFNMISGKSVSSASNTTDYFKDSNPMCVFIAIRLSYEVAEHLHIHLTPQYDLNIGGDQIFEVIKQGDSKIKAWGEGFGVNAGIIYEF